MFRGSLRSSASVLEKASTASFSRTPAASFGPSPPGARSLTPSARAPCTALSQNKLSQIAIFSIANLDYFFFFALLFLEAAFFFVFFFLKALGISFSMMAFTSSRLRSAASSFVIRLLSLLFGSFTFFFLNLIKGPQRPFWTLIPSSSQR